jgi:hypothetical protein
MLDIAGADVERGEQRRGPMTFVVVCESPSPTLLERQARLRPIQCLNLTLLHREANDVAQFGDEVGIG